MNSKIRMRTNDGRFGIPVEITCNHAVAWEEAGGGKTVDADAAPPMHAIEIAPGGVLYRCCSWCAAFIQVNALKSLLEKGVAISLTPPVPEKPPMLFVDTARELDNFSDIVEDEWAKALAKDPRTTRCKHFSPENAADSEPKQYCRLPAGHGCSCIFPKR